MRPTVYTSDLNANAFVIQGKRTKRQRRRLATRLSLVQSRRCWTSPRSSRRPFGRIRSRPFHVLDRPPSPVSANSELTTAHNCADQEIDRQFHARYWTNKGIIGSKDQRSDLNSDWSNYAHFLQCPIRSRATRSSPWEEWRRLINQCESSNRKH